MDIQPSEISAILKREIRDFGAEAQVSEVGQVLSVGDGIARVYGLDNVKAGEMVEFPGGIKGMALPPSPALASAVTPGGTVPSRRERAVLSRHSCPPVPTPAWAQPRSPEGRSWT